MGYSKNYRSLILYSGILGAFLKDYQTNPDNSHYNWFDQSLVVDANWLRNNNPYIKSYSSFFTNHHSIPTFPVAMHIADKKEIPPFRQVEIVLHLDFPNEIHNEDAHYSRLMTGFQQLKFNTNLDK
ncbi:hypothetical protein Glove_562g17 [Diversispora epigaea]|uniref:Uncharacterized protein n=1 Tax=Diversispora epigaea TaxID=1348612 RepID=A0A397GD22_9GLOM|nr:hypothetical protein Glove_562g17 [Diversispora epigaea]